MRRFVFQRVEDETGVSGTGIVVEGVQFTDGHVALTWISETRSVTTYNSIEDATKIHGHHGRTKLVWIDEGTKYQKLLAAKNQ